MTIPLGKLSDNHGRRLVFYLNTSGNILMVLFTMIIGGVFSDSNMDRSTVLTSSASFPEVLPIKIILVAPALTIIDREDYVYMATSLTAINNITSHETSRYEKKETDGRAIINGSRTVYFSYLNSVSYVVPLISPLIAATAMQINMWLPSWISLIALSVALMITSLLPGSNELEKQRAHSFHSILESDSALDPMSPSMYAGWSYINSATRTARSFVRSLKTSLAVASHFRTLLLISFVTSFANSSTSILLRYISKRYNKTFAEVGSILHSQVLSN
jgi:MFS family permease